MGVTLKSPNKSIDLGYGGFMMLRRKVAELTTEDIGEHYKYLSACPIFGQKEVDEFYKNYDAKIATLSAKYNGAYDSILRFLYSSDCEAEIDVSICEEIYAIIKTYEDDIAYGYCGRKDCATFKDFKAIVKDCIDTNTKMCWY